MARGAAGAGQDILKANTATANQLQSQAGNISNTLIPGYTSLMNTGYLNPQEQAAATTSEMGAATQPFESEKFGAANRAAASGNAAGLGAEDTALAREQGITAGEAASNLQREKMANQEAGMYGLGEQESGIRGEAMGMYGLGPSTINAWSQAQMNNPYLSFFKSFLPGGGGAGPAMAAGS